ncbi:MAG: YrbL family protein [Phascolarctobacterium sp.]|nr:YrbL family protein [Phascolarctobacterium sp.]
MTSASDILYLKDADIIGEGAHKITYKHPNNKALCIKIAKQGNDIDLKRELDYRNVLQKKKKTPKLLPLYYGTTKTNKGTAHVFERICNYDNQTSLTLEQYINKAISNSSIYDAQKHLMDLLLSFKQEWFEERIVTSNIELANFMVQYKNPNEARIKIVDNIGTPVLIPLAYYLDFFAIKRASRYWKQFLDVLKSTFPVFFSHEMINQLSK